MIPMNHNLISMIAMAIMVLMASGCRKNSGDHQDAPSSHAESKKNEQVDPFRELVATVKTSQGSFSFRMLPERTPLTIASFCRHAQSGHYQGQKWHGYTRVIRQTGRDIGTVEPGYTLPPEFAPEFVFDAGGRVAMIPAGADSPGRIHPCVFFVTVKNQERWNLEFPIFGNIIEGMDVVNKIGKDDLVISVEIVPDPTPLLEALADHTKSWGPPSKAVQSTTAGSPSG